jgi:hypothetical protein
VDRLEPDAFGRPQVSRDRIAEHAHRGLSGLNGRVWSKASHRAVHQGVMRLGIDLRPAQGQPDFSVLGVCKLDPFRQDADDLQ